MNLHGLPVINLNLCTRCGICVSKCPENAMEMAAHGPIINKPSQCTYCTECEKLCPTGAIRAPLTVVWQTNNG